MRHPTRLVVADLLHERWKRCSGLHPVSDNKPKFKTKLKTRLVVADLVHELEALQRLALRDAHVLLRQRAGPEGIVEVEKAHVGLDAQEGGDVLVVGQRRGQACGAEGIMGSTLRCARRERHANTGDDNRKAAKSLLGSVADRPAMQACRGDWDGLGPAARWCTGRWRCKAASAIHKQQKYITHSIGTAQTKRCFLLLISNGAHPRCGPSPSCPLPGLGTTLAKYHNGITSYVKLANCSPTMRTISWLLSTCRMVRATMDSSTGPRLSCSKWISSMMTSFTSWA